MSKSFDFLGAYKNHFLKSSLDVYTNLKGTMQYVGKTQNQKTLSPGVENVEWFDNTGAVQTLFALDIDKVDPKINYSFMQISDPNVLALALNMDMDMSDANVVRLFMGSNPDTYAEAQWRFVCRSVGGLLMTLVVRRGISFSNGDITFGAPGNYAEVPVTTRMLQDTSITDTKRDLCYWEIQRRSFS